MKLQAFSIYDTAAKAFNRPFFQNTKGQAIRGFSDAVNDESTELWKHPEDYILFELGEFDDSDGSFLPMNPTKVVTAMEVHEGKQQ